MLTNLTSATLLIALKVAVGFIIALLMLTGVQHCQNSRLSDKLVRAQLNVERAVEANGTLVKTTDELRSANEVWAARHAADMNEAERAAERERLRAERLAAELADKNRELEDAYATPDCEEWARTRMCGAVSDSLWHNESRHPD